MFVNMHFCVCLGILITVMTDIDMTSAQDAAAGDCIAFGDPHFNTFDGYGYNFNGQCSYYLAKPCNQSSDPKTSWFMIAFNKRIPHRADIAKVDRVGIFVLSKVVAITAGADVKGIVQIDGSQITFPYMYGNGLLNITREDGIITMSANFGLTVTFKAGKNTNRVIVNLREDLKDKLRDRMCGLCGNMNGKADDDFMKKDGKLTHDVKLFGESWLHQTC